MSEYPTILGNAEIPKDYSKTQTNKANKCREILAMIPAGKALIIEFDSKKDANDYRSMLYTMSILKYGESGHIGTRINDNVMYIWEVHAAS